MLRLIYDTETTGFAQQGLPDDHPGQPHLVQLAAILAEDDGKKLTREVASINFIVKPDGWTIPEAASRVHGITTEVATRLGVPHTLVVAAFANLRALADELIAHNKEFDRKIMAAAFAREKKKTGRGPSHPGPSRHSCTVELAKPIMKLPPTAKMVAAGYGHEFKNPNLGECYKHFFGEELVGAHGALADARACMKVFYHILEKAA